MTERIGEDMLKKMLAIIPARGGSKGLPNKNILDFDGEPLIARTVKTALKSKYIDDVIVSTDSEAIAEAAVKAGAENPFMRPQELATDTAKVIDTFVYTLETLKEKYNREYEKVIILQPTSPLRETKDIDEAIELYERKNALTIMSVVEAEIPPEWYLTIDDHLFMKNYIEELSSKNRQEYKKLYLPNGAIYIFDVKNLLETKLYKNDRTYAYIMNKENSIDIDDIYDFLLAEAIVKRNKKEGK